MSKRNQVHKMCTMLMRLLARPWDRRDWSSRRLCSTRGSEREREGEREEAPNPIPSLNHTCSLVLGLGQLRFRSGSVSVLASWTWMNNERLDEFVYMVPIWENFWMRDVCTYMAGNCCISFFHCLPLARVIFFRKNMGSLVSIIHPKMCIIHSPKFVRAATSTRGTLGLKRDAIGNIYGEHTGNTRNILRTHWELEGNMLETKEKKIKALLWVHPPPLPPIINWGPLNIL